jgi:hypothetical protein
VSGDIVRRDEAVYANHCDVRVYWKKTVKKEASYRGWIETGVYVLPKKV